VLGLAGHDWSVLPWMLEAGADIPPGPCHVRCLREGGIGRRWAGAVEEYHCARWPRWRAGADGGVRWRLHDSRAARRFHLWRADGRLSSFPYAALRPGALLIVTDLAEAADAHAVDLLDAMGAELTVPLGGVIAALGLTDRYPAVTGWLSRRLRGGGDVLVARHSLALDPDCHRAAHRLIREPA
jgi:hypothetical protein